ncbi:MAG: Fe-S cluster assembly protein SufD [Proteobacteria bacterium]|nr:Fe-S cluster assembly protein SufD [Pseudomonadota bacterium]
MNVALVKPTPERAAGDVFATARSRLPGTGPVSELREASYADFAGRGLPHRRIEEWKYTDLRTLLREVAPLAARPEADALKRAAEAYAALEITDACRLVLVDGFFAPELSDLGALGRDVDIRSLREVLENADNSMRADLLRTNATADAMVSLNAAMATDGVVVGVGDNVTLAKPLHLVHIATQSSTSAFTRSLVRIGKGARVTLVESFVAAPGTRTYQVHDAVVLWAGEGADVQHVRLVEDAHDAANISTAIVTLSAKTVFNTLSLTTGAMLSRYQAFIRFGGEHASASINGVNLLKERQHGDATLVLDHMVPNCESREVFRAVVDDRAHSVFQGRINVHPDAQKTDAKMMTRALLLSDEAEADNKPELEIFADDVTCGHGAAIGALDESLLFYLRARGLSEKEAQSLLIQAFVGEAIESIVDDGLREVAVAAAERWLAARG